MQVHAATVHRLLPQKRGEPFHEGNKTAARGNIEKAVSKEIGTIFGNMLAALISNHVGQQVFHFEIEKR
jgi:hypothetical protein